MNDATQNQGRANDATTNHAMMPDGLVDVAVIGGGLAGLTAAATAARHGARTVLLDARTVGGRARSVDRNGFTLNEGGHALYRSAGGWEVLSGLGVTPTGGRPPLDDAHTVWNGEIVDLPVAGRDVLASRLLSARSKLKLGRWFLNPGALAAGVGPNVSFGEWLDGERAADDLRTYVLTIARLGTYAARPEDLPARAVLGQIGNSPEGVLYLDGGWQSLVDALAAVAFASGAAILGGAPVTTVDRTGRHWGVTTSRGDVEARSIVLAAGGPALAADLLGADDAGWVERAGPPMRAACLDIGSDTSGYGVLLSSDEPLYCIRHAPAARLAPAGHTLYAVMRYLAPDDSSSAAQNRVALDRHARRAGLPARDARAVDRFLAAPVVAWGTPTVGLVRPDGLELSERGVFAAGDWVGDRLLADASIVSGARAGIAAAQRVTVAA